jgi:AAA15 family ATPase/GTPase
MIVQFSVKNYKIFEREAKISFVASKYYMEKADQNVVDFPKFGLKLLKSAVIYGANASGKTKLFESMDFFKKFILASAKETQIKEPIPVDPFRLSDETIENPSVFEMIFIHKNEMYRYGFEVTAEKVKSEWLFYRPHKREMELFTRTEQHFEIHKTLFNVQDLVDRKRIRHNALMLSTAAAWNEDTATTVVSWFKEHLNIISGLREQQYMSYSISQLRHEKTKNEMLKLIQNADLGIEDLKARIIEMIDLKKEISEELIHLLKIKGTEGAEWASDVVTTHRKFNKNKVFTGLTHFSMDADESSGTKKYFALSGPILETLKNGEILIMDELDAKLHPNLTHKLIELFHSKNHNSLNAQLLFNTHNTNLLDFELFRRDQIWFTEKDRYGSATLYSLSDIKGVRKSDPLEKNYMEGRYGAIPFLNGFNESFNSQL